MIETMIVYLMLWVAVTVVFVKGDIFEAFKTVIIRVTPTFFGMDMYMSLLLYCAMCSGFWIGIAGAFVIDPVWIPSDIFVIRVVLSGFTVALSAAIVDRGIYGESHRTD